MKKLFVRKPSGGGWVFTVDGKEYGCCECELEEHLEEQIMSVFDEKGIDEIMITIETIKKVEIDVREPVKGRSKKQSIFGARKRNGEK